MSLVETTAERYRLHLSDAAESDTPSCGASIQIPRITIRSDLFLFMRRMERLDGLDELFFHHRRGIDKVMFVILAIMLVMLVLLVVWVMMQLLIVVFVLEVLLVVVRPRVVMMDMMIVLIVKLLRSSGVMFRNELMPPIVVIRVLMRRRVVLMLMVLMNMPNIDLVHVRMLDMTMSGFHHQMSLQFAHPIHIHLVQSAETHTVFQPVSCSSALTSSVCCSWSCSSTSSCGSNA
jgi:hypothetical protein